MVAVNREGSSCGLHLVISCDVVLDKKRDAMERTTNLSSAAFVIEPCGDRDRIRIQLNHRVQQRIERLDASDVILRQFPARQLAGRHGTLKLGNTLFNKVKTARC